MADAWKIGTLEEARMVAANVKSLTFRVEGWEPHLPGQHYDIRLTAPDGYRAERSYSAASTPDHKGRVEFGIQLLENGEVSPYLYGLTPGGQIELRGPIGGHFIWTPATPGPLCLVGGGSGMVPLMSMLRTFAARADERSVIFLISARTEAHILYRDELEEIARAHSNVRIVPTLTDAPPQGWTGYARRIDRNMLEEVFGAVRTDAPRFFCCGPTPFVEAAASILRDSGIPHADIKTERFGGA
jgi:ferredoxin-NADP reductase